MPQPQHMGDASEILPCMMMDVHSDLSFGVRCSAEYSACHLQLSLDYLRDQAQVSRMPSCEP